jgi:hypothetical protein
MKKLTLIMVMFLAIAACRKIEVPPTQAIDLGVQSQSTSIKTISQVNNIVTAEFETTPGAKYSVQIVPFGSDEPAKKDGFTADNTITKKVYDLSSLKRMDYDLIFIDISGKEIKYPLIIK